MSWQFLDAHASVDSKLPTLLISTTFRSTSYVIHLTDLTHIWSESLERRDIYRRSQEENTSIDPTDGDQIHVLLDKIRVGIEGAKGTSLSLSINQNAYMPEITLSITVDLPGGLSPLEWSIYLTSAPQLLLTAQLTVPLLEAQQMRMREMASLAGILREKDQVIQKLLDKLESQGAEFGQIFPHIAGKSGRKIDRTNAEEKVKGLKLFDMQVWKQGLEKDESQDVEQLASQLFRSDGASDLNIKGPSNVLKGPEKWWESLKGDTFVLQSKKPTSHEQSMAKKGQGPAKHSKKEESIQDDDQFQVQSTPPHFAANEQKARAEQPMDDESTEDDDDDLDAPSQKSKRPGSLPPSQQGAKSPAKVPKKLGTLGTKRELPKPLPEDDDETTEGSTPSLSPVQESPRREERAASAVAEPTIDKPRGLGRIGGKKASPQPEAEQPAKELLKLSRGRLGQIGGKKKEVIPTPPEPEPEAVTSPPKPALETKKKLGSLGGPKLKTGEKASVKPSEEPKGRSVKQEEKEPPPRETSEERADKKREQLKKELEEKAKAPVKKKRKF